MKYEISKELFEAVMGSYSHFGTLCNREFDCIIDNEILYYEKYNGNTSISINDFFFKCIDYLQKNHINIDLNTNSDLKADIFEYIDNLLKVNKRQ